MGTCLFVLTAKMCNIYQVKSPFVLKIKYAHGVFFAAFLFNG